VLAYTIPFISYVFSLAGLAGIVSSFKESNYIWLTAVIPILVMIIFVAPYKIWRKTNDELTKITTKRFELSLPAPNRIERRDSVRGDWFQEWYRIQVRNPTALPISLCYGRLVEFKSKLPYPNLPSPGIMFPWTSFGGKEKLTTIANQDSDLLDIVVFDGNCIRIVILDDASGHRNLGQFALLVDEYDLVIRIGSQAEPFPPNYVIIRIKPYVQNFKEYLKVTMINYNSDCSTELSKVD
jgi:hypothetical protein